MGLSNGTQLTATSSSLILQARYSGLSYSSAPGGSFFAAVAAAGGSVSPARQTLINNLISGLQADGNYALIDNLWLPAGGNYQSGIIDIKGLVQATPVGMGAAPYAGNFTVDRGFTTTTTAYLNLGTQGGPNYIQDRGMFGCAQRIDNTLQAMNSMGSINTNSTALCELFTHYSDAGIYAGVNAVNAVTFGTGASATIGIFLVARSSSSTTTVYKNGTLVYQWTGGSAVASNGIPNQNFCLGGAFDTAGTFSNGGAAVSQQFSAAVIGGVTGDANIANLNSRIQTYLTAVGA